MGIKYLTGSALAGLVLAGGIAGMVSAQTAADATGLTEEQIIEIALTEVPGEVTDVEQKRHRGLPIFAVDILGADGAEMEVEIGAETGEIVKVRAEGADCDKDHDERERDDEA